MNDDKITTKAKRWPGLLELIALLAAAIPCNLEISAFLGVERIQDILSVGQRSPGVLAADIG